MKQSLGAPQIATKDPSFSKYVFTEEVMEKRLPPSTFVKLQQLLREGGNLDPQTADVVAFGMKEWASELGASCFAHWFQPLSLAGTAKKYDSFLNLKDQFSKKRVTHFLSEFTGKQLIQGEPDGSSFPNGGLRNVHQARGYTAWDYNTPVFIIKDEFQGVLYIPAVFCSIFGLSLDSKTPLLRSERAVGQTISRFMGILGRCLELPAVRKEHKVSVTVGLEQEMFIVDREMARKRDDLVHLGRTVFGRRPPRAQQMKDHYWGVMPKRILDCLGDVKQRMWELGIPITTIHNEVAPAQYEAAPIFESSSIATDHNMIFMKQLDVVARQHGLMVLFHEKPFDGVNGSGKHLNWSLLGNGENLLTFGKGEAERFRFLFLATALVRAVDEHYDLMRAATLTPGNIARLGGYEAPPSIISIFVGERLERCIEDMLRDEATLECSPLMLSFGVETLPSFQRDQSDRNRTSPIAFIGNRFEFRSIGSSQNPAWPLTVVNTIFADALAEMLDEADELLTQGVGGRDVLERVIKQNLKLHSRIIYNGDCYSDEYRREMTARGIDELKTTSSVLTRMLSAQSIEAFERQKVLSRQEAAARVSVFSEHFVESAVMEATLMVDLVVRHFYHVTLHCAQTEAKALSKLPGVTQNMTSRVKTLVDLSSKMLDQAEQLKDALRRLEEIPEQQLVFCEETIYPLMDGLRRTVDAAECLVDKEAWEVPSYEELWTAHT